MRTTKEHRNRSRTGHLETQPDEKWKRQARYTREMVRTSIIKTETQEQIRQAISEYNLKQPTDPFHESQRITAGIIK